MSLEQLKEQTDMLRGLSDSNLAFLESEAREVSFDPGAMIFDEDDIAGEFYLLAAGRVALEVPIHGRPGSVVETLGPGDLLGVSWLFPPYRWSWRARAQTAVTALVFDASAVRRACETDLDLAAHVYKTVAAEAVRRLHAARIRFLDIYPGDDLG